MARNILRRTTSGDVTTADAYLHAVILTAGSDDATVVVRAGGSGGTHILNLGASSTTGTSVSCDLGGVLCAEGIHVTLTGTSPAVSVVYE